MRAIILLYAQEGYINIPVDDVKLRLNQDMDDITTAMLMLEKDHRLVGMFQMSEVKGFYLTERKSE